jgi:pyruvate/2-oxoglutarate dehydrogenase complex dihydrolipoamide dehydrogenase (E3) component
LFVAFQDVNAGFILPIKRRAQADAKEAVLGAGQRLRKWPVNLAELKVRHIDLTNQVLEVVEREARQLGQYGIAVSEPVLDYPRLLARVRKVVHDVRACSTWREQIDALGVSVHERAGLARFVDPHTIESVTGLRLRAEKFILCTGGISRRLDVRGFEFTNTHSDAWSLTSVPASASR